MRACHCKVNGGISLFYISREKEKKKKGRERENSIHNK